MAEKHGFTLIELIVVIAIIAILAAVVAPNAFKAVEKSKISAAVADIKTIKTAALDFYSDTGNLPCTKCGGWGKDPGFINMVTPATCWPDEGGCDAGCTNVSGWDGPYLEKWPNSSPWGLGGGGKYNWNRWVNYSPPGTGANCTLAGIVTLEGYTAVPVVSLQKIDSIIDDGNLSGGYVFAEGNISNPSFLQFVVTCH